ncbi:MAG: non-homologous end-joining DNA ligase [Micromonospora sp.]
MTDGSLPELIPPMLAAAGAIPTGAGWAYEFKWDGVRAITYADRGQVRVLSRNNNDVTGTYPELGAVGAALGRRRAVVDGEIVALEAGNRPSFSRLQARMHVSAPTSGLLHGTPVVYYVFDVLHLDGRSTLELPYTQRRELLAELDLAAETVRVPAHYLDVDGAEVLRAAELAGLEGVIAKRLAAPYRPGRRSTDWTKVPLVRTQEVVIVGYTPGGGRRAGTIGSLLLGVYDDAGDLVYAGHVGTGFTHAALRALQQQLAPLHRRTSPAAGVPRADARHATWVVPTLLGEVAYRTWTPDGRLRHPSWRGLRPDRDLGAARRPAAAVEPSEPTAVEGAMQTVDGTWRVEVLRRDGHRWYRLVHDDNLLDWLSLADVERLLAEAGVGLHMLEAVEAA